MPASRCPAWAGPASSDEPAGDHCSTRAGCTSHPIWVLIAPRSPLYSRGLDGWGIEIPRGCRIVSAPTRCSHRAGQMVGTPTIRLRAYVGRTWSRNRVTPSASHRLRTYTGGTRTDSTSTRPTVNNVVPVQDGCGRSLRPALLGPHPGNRPRPPLRLPLVTRRVAPCRFRQAANAAPRARRRSRYAAPAPGGSGGLFSSRACLILPLCTGPRGKP